MSKDKEWSNLLKLPSEIIIKELRIELGKSNSMIDELNDIISKQNEICKSKEIKKAHLENLEVQIKTLKEKLEKSTDRNRILQLQMFSIQRQLLANLNK